MSKSIGGFISSESTAKKKWIEAASAPCKVQGLAWCSGDASPAILQTHRDDISPWRCFLHLRGHDIFRSRLNWKQCHGAAMRYVHASAPAIFRDADEIPWNFQAMFSRTIFADLAFWRCFTMVMECGIPWARYPRCRYSPATMFRDADTC